MPSTVPLKDTLSFLPAPQSDEDSPQSSTRLLFVLRPDGESTYSTPDVVDAALEYFEVDDPQRDKTALVDHVKICTYDRFEQGYTSPTIDIFRYDPSEDRMHPPSKTVTGDECRRMSCYGFANEEEHKRYTERKFDISRGDIKDDLFLGFMCNKEKTHLTSLARRWIEEARSGELPLSDRVRIALVHNTRDQTKDPVWQLYADDKLWSTPSGQQPTRELESVDENDGSPGTAIIEVSSSRSKRGTHYRPGSSKYKHARSASNSSINTVRKVESGSADVQVETHGSRTRRQTRYRDDSRARSSISREVPDNELVKTVMALVFSRPSVAKKDGAKWEVVHDTLLRNHPRGDLDLLSRGWDYGTDYPSAAQERASKETLILSDHLVGAIVSTFSEHEGETDLDSAAFRSSELGKLSAGFPGLLEKVTAFLGEDERAGGSKAVGDARNNQSRFSSRKGTGTETDPGVDYDWPPKRSKSGVSESSDGTNLTVPSRLSRRRSHSNSGSDTEESSRLSHGRRYGFSAPLPDLASLRRDVPRRLRERSPSNPPPDYYDGRTDEERFVDDLSSRLEDALEKGQTWTDDEEDTAAIAGTSSPSAEEYHSRLG